MRRRESLDLYESFNPLWQTRMSGELDWETESCLCYVERTACFWRFLYSSAPPPPIHFTHCYRNRNIQLTLSMFFPFKVIKIALLTLSFLKLTRLYTSSAGYADYSMANHQQASSNTCLTSHQCCGSMTFWCGSGSADFCLWLMDPDPPIFVIDLQEAN